MIKMKIYRDWELETTGVTPIWSYICDYKTCWLNQIGGHYTLFWENAIKAADIHIKYHESLYEVPNA